MSLLYGYNQKKGSAVASVNSLKSLVGTKTDDKTDNTVFGRIQKNKEDIDAVEQKTKFSSLEKITTSLFILLDVNPGPHFINKNKAPKWRPFDSSNPHIHHANEIYITSVRMSMLQTMSWVLSVELFESEMRPHSVYPTSLVLKDPNDKGVSIVKFSTNDIKQNKFKSVVSTANPLGYKLQDPAVFNGFKIHHIKKSGESSGVKNSLGRKIYIDIIFKSYDKLGDHWWKDK